MNICSTLFSTLLFFVFLSVPSWAKTFTLDSQGNIVYKTGQVLGESASPAPPLPVPSQTFVFSADKYELRNDHGQIKVSTFQIKEASSTAQKFEFMKGGDSFEISTEGQGFTLIDKGEIGVRTDLPLVVKKSSRSLWLVTPTGEKEIKLTAGQIVENLVKAKIMTKVELSRKEVSFPQGSPSVAIRQNYLRILDSSSGAYYSVGGEKETKFLGLLPLSFPVEAKVDVSDGKILEVRRPWFLDKLAFLFSN